MIYSAIMGRAAAKYALFRLERGDSIGTLEQLMQSRTLSSTFVTQFQLRNFKKLGIILMVVWAFSPIGSQSPLRLFSTKSIPVYSNSTLPYLDTIENDLFGAYDQLSYYLAQTNSAYLTAMLGSDATKNGPMDTRGNVKIPYMSKLQNQTDQNWWLVPSGNDLASIYSSLLGIPIGNFNSQVANFSLESTYISLDCSDLQTGLHIDTLGHSTNKPNGTFVGVNITNPDCNAVDALSLPNWEVAVDVFVDSQYYSGGIPEQFVSDTGIVANQGRLLFQSAAQTEPLINGTVAQFTIAYCNISQEYVESNVACTMELSVQICRVTAQRPSKLAHAPSEITFLSFPGYFSNLASSWELATGRLPRSPASTPTELYLQSPDTAYILSPALAALGNVSASTFSDRLGQLLNTYLQGGELTLSLAPGNERNTTCYMTNFEEIYVCSWGWLVVLFLSSFLMLIGAFYTIWLRTQTTIPDLLGFVSSLTRDAKYLDFPGGGTTDGMERTKLLRAKEIKFGVLEQDGEGENEGQSERLALTTPERVTRPVTGRFYL